MLKTLQSLQGIINPEIFRLELKKELAECGIALVFVPHLKGSFLQGATFMDGNKIVVGLTARGKDADKFWFSLFHELAQIILGHVNQLNGTTEDDEKEAYFLFLKNKKIAPGIVVGRKQKEGVIGYNKFNELKEKYGIAI